MKTMLPWLSKYRPSTHTFVILLTAFQTGYLADTDIQHVVNQIVGAHPVMHAITGYCLLVLALYRNGAVNGNKNEKEQ